MRRISIREFEIVESVIYHGSKKEAADALNRSLYTIETTIKNVYERLGINKISDLTLWFCGVKFGISDQVEAFKNVAFAIALVLIISLEVINNDIISIQEPFSTQSAQNIGQNRIRRRRKEKSVNVIDIQITKSYAA